MENVRKNPIKPLGRFNWIVRIGKEKFWHLQYVDESIPSTQYKKVWTCNYGCLLISQGNHSNQFSIWKPESSELINLPSLNLKPKQIIVAGTLLYPPGNTGSMVILFEKTFRHIMYYRFGDKQWINKWLGKEIANIGHDGHEDRIYHECISYCDGKLYAATFAQSYLMVIEENKYSKNLKLRPLNCRLPALWDYDHITSRFLLDCCGQLCFVEVSWGGVNEKDIIDIEIMKLELRGNRKKWVRVISIENRVFFLCNLYAFSCPVNESEIEGGHIYLFQHNRLYSFNIKDKSCSASQSLQNLSGFENSPFLTMQDLIRLCNPQVEPEHPISKLEVKKLGMVIEDFNEARTDKLCDLPYDILGFIANKLYQIDYINFRSVCHKFLLVAPHIKWSGSSFKLQSPSLSPWLVFRKGYSGSTHNFIDSYFGSTYFIKIPECLLHGKIRYSKDGWLLICDHSSMFFYHPFTKNLIKLPQEVKCLSYGLSSSPTTADSILVGFNISSIHFFFQRLGEWFDYDIEDFSDFLPNQTCPIYFGGAFYFLGKDGKVALFRFNDGQVTWETFKELQSPCDNFCYNWLLECDGNLLSVFVVDQLVHIYKLNFDPIMTWKKVTSLENHALFVSSSSSFSVIPNYSNMKNKVYFSIIYGTDIVYYCLSNHKFYTYRGKEVADFKNTTKLIFSTWIEPNWQS